MIVLGRDVLTFVSERYVCKLETSGTGGKLTVRIQTINLTPLRK